MSDLIDSEGKLHRYCAELAREAVSQVFEDGGDENDLHDWLFESVDSCEHVIYYHKARTICCECNTDQGEQWLEDSGGIEPGLSFDDICVRIAFGEIYQRSMDSALELFELAGGEA